MEYVLVTSLIVSIGFPSNLMTTSPGWNPARSAGEPGVTCKSEQEIHQDLETTTLS